MKLEEIKQALMNGQPVCRYYTWPDGYYMYLRGEQLRCCIEDENGTKICVSHCTFTDKAFSLDDLFADDWELYEFLYEFKNK